MDVPHSHAAAARAVALVRAGEAVLLMKGSLHTDELMHEVVAAETGLRTERRLSHVYRAGCADISAAVADHRCRDQHRPTLEIKRDIVQNAIDLAHVMGVKSPGWRSCAAVEMVNPEMRSTVDAAALCKMADRGQITGGIVDGPLAFDNAVSPKAARDKGIVSPVAGGPTSWWCRTWRPATCWPSSLPSWPALMRRAWLSVLACRSF